MLRELKEIPVCDVFPRVSEEEAQEEVQTPLTLIETSLDNYASMRENPEDSSIEVERAVDRRFAARICKRRVRKRFLKGSNSRMALLVKVKEDGSKKRRLIVDLKRSGANARARAPERVVLP